MTKSTLLSIHQNCKQGYNILSYTSTPQQNRLNMMIRFKVDSLILSQFTNDIIDRILIKLTLVEVDANIGVCGV